MELFKVMVRAGDWKYIYCANGRRRLLFNVTEDPDELTDLTAAEPDVVADLHIRATAFCDQPGAIDALDGDDLRGFDFAARTTPDRIYQFDHSRGVTGFPDTPEEGIRAWREREGL